MKLWLGSKVAGRIERVADTFHPLETGGVLLGWRDGEDRIVAEVIGAGPLALHGKVRFLPDHEWQLTQINQAFRHTNGDLDYLGDWHTHPDGVAKMSSEDRFTLQRIARKVEDPVMLIAAGNRSLGWTMEAWLQRKRSIFSNPAPDDLIVEMFQQPDSWPGYLDGTI